MDVVNPPRAANRNRALGVLMDGEVRFRPELARRLGLSLMAVMRITKELTEVGLIAEGAKKARPEPGRPPTELAINPSGAYVLGFEVHAFQQSMALLDLSRR